MAPHQPEEDDRPTSVTCLACGGDYEKRYETAGQYRVETCRWCAGGRMTVRQIVRWRAHLRGED
jgi:hypothetical protein